MNKKVRNFTMLILIGGSLTLTSCRDNKSNEADDANHEMNSEEHMDHDNMMEDENSDEMGMSEATAKFSDEQMAAVFQQYAKIQAALALDNPQDAKDGAKMLITSLAQAEKTKALVEPTKKIANTDDINSQREAFSELTAQLGAALDGALSGGEVYKIYCPMAFEGKGDYWYANTKDIRNPYFGSKMLNCGRVEETLK